MEFNPRIKEILAIMARKRSVKVQELKDRLGVSEVTIRKDLDFLEGEGIIQRIHGGAVMAQDHAIVRSFGMREGLNFEAKMAIARAAVALVPEGETVYIDAGTTCRLFAGQLAGKALQVVTNSLDVANALAKDEGLILHVLGGTYRHESCSLIGPRAVEELSNINIQTCFIGATGFLGDGSFSSQNTIEAHLKRQALKVSRRRVILADSSKYGISAFSIFAKAMDVDILITDSGFADASALRSQDIEVLLATEGARSDEGEDSKSAGSTAKERP